MIDQIFPQAVDQHQSGNLEEAERLYREVLQLDANHVHSLSNLGSILSRKGQVQEAFQIYQRALQIDPNFGEGWYNLGVNFQRSGDPVQAERSFRQALSLNNGLYPAAVQLGRSLNAQGKFQENEQLCRHILTQTQQDPEVYSQLGRALLSTGRPDEGIECYQAVVKLKPNDPKSYHQLALGFLECGRWEEGIAQVRHALHLEPNYPRAHNTLAIALEAAKDPDTALHHSRESVRLDPNFAEGWNNLGNMYSLQGRADQAVECFRKSLALEPRAPHIHSNLLLNLNYLPNVSVEAIAEEHRQWAKLFLGNVTPAPSHANHAEPERVLRVGLVSPDFRDHTVMAFLEPLIDAVDRSRIQLFAYANVPREDAVTQRARAKVDAWHNTFRSLDTNVAEQIVRDQIDILVDFAGHTAGNRLTLFALRPAPVQVTQFGYPNTSAVPAMTYRISDNFADPPQMTEKLYTETIHRLDGLAWCWKAPEGIPEPVVSEREGVIFGSFNNLAKINPTVLETWAAILNGCPGSILRLLAGPGKESKTQIREVFRSKGVDPERIEFLARMSKPDYFQAQGDLDIALDPFPYNGGVTTCDALWMGTPVVTLAGSSYVSRQGVSLLSNLDMTDWIAADQEAYVALVTSHIHDRDKLKALRTSLRAKMLASPIVDWSGYARRWEEALRTMWKTWCASRE